MNVYGGIMIPKGTGNAGTVNCYIYNELQSVINNLAVEDEKKEEK